MTHYSVALLMVSTATMTIQMKIKLAIREPVIFTVTMTMTDYVDNSRNGGYYSDTDHESDTAR